MSDAPTRKRKRTEEFLVSNKGRVLSSHTTKSFGSTTVGGYKTKLFQGRPYFVHQLVARAFIGPPPTITHTVDHIDRNPANNDVANLRWSTKAEQSTNRVLPKHIDGLPVCVTDPAGEVIVYQSALAAASALNCSATTIKRHSASEVRLRGYKIEIPVTDGLPNELWQEVAATGWYVSNAGRLLRKNASVTTGHVTRTGYCKVTINGKSHFVHRLVAVAFLPSPQNNNLTVDHINRNKTDNRAENLRWATQSEQVTHSYAGGRARINTAKKPVEFRKAGGTDWMVRESVDDVATELDISRQVILKMCLGNRKSTVCDGYEFRYHTSPDLPGEVWLPAVLPPR
jgi:hypothetical protein